jgi:hypothetical protein
MPMPPNRKFGYSKAEAALFEPFPPFKKEATDQVAFCFLLFSSTEQKIKLQKSKP